MNKEYFGIKGIFSSYRWQDFLCDSVIPTVISLIIVICLKCFFKNDTHVLLEKIASLGLSILPSYLGLLVAAYTILLSLITTNIGEKLMNLKDNTDCECSGKNLIHTLNSQFAMCILFTVFSLIFFVVVFIISVMNIECEYAEFINSIVLLLLTFLLSYSLIVLIGLIEDIFNIGQSSTIL